MSSLAGRVEYHSELAPKGLAEGKLKIDQSLVMVYAGNPITGEERISRSTLHHEIGVRALEIHDQLVAAGEKIPHAAEVRTHLLRVIELSKDPVEGE